MTIYRIPHVNVEVGSRNGRKASFTRQMPAYEVPVLRACHEGVPHGRTVKQVRMPAKPLTRRDPFRGLRSRVVEADTVEDAMLQEMSRLSGPGVYKKNDKTGTHPFTMAYRSPEEFEEAFRKVCAVLFEHEQVIPRESAEEEAEIGIEYTAGELAAIERAKTQSAAGAEQEPAKLSIPEEAEDELCQLKCVDDVRASLFYHAGLRTVADVAAADPEELLSFPRIGERTAQTISEHAQELCRDNFEE